MTRKLLTEDQYALKKLKAVSFPATNRELCKKFVGGHRIALAENEILNITSNNEDWIGDESIHCLMITNEEDMPVAGLRIESFTKHRKVPIQEIATDLTQLVDEFAERELKRNEELAELCALWVHPEYRSNKMAIEITVLGVTKGFNLGINSLILIGAQHSERISDKVGFIRCDDVMQDQPFLTYPNPDYRAVVRQLLDIDDSIHSVYSETDEGASVIEAAYDRIRKYLLRPRGVAFVKSSDKIYSIVYDLYN